MACLDKTSVAISLYFTPSRNLTIQHLFFLTSVKFLSLWQFFFPNPSADIDLAQHSVIISHSHLASCPSFKVHCWFFPPSLHFSLLISVTIFSWFFPFSHASVLVSSPYLASFLRFHCWPFFNSQSVCLSWISFSSTAPSLPFQPQLLPSPMWTLGSSHTVFPISYVLSEPNAFVHATSFILTALFFFGLLVT